MSYVDLNTIFIPSLGEVVPVEWLSQIRENLEALHPVWEDYTPVHFNLTLGNGSQVARFARLGNHTVMFSVAITFGSTTSISGTPRVGLPVEPAQSDPMTAAYTDLGLRNHAGIGILSSTGAILQHTEGTNNNAVSATVPFTWTTGDRIRVAGTYEI